MFIAVSMFSCTSYIEYDIEIQTVVNDSLKESQKEYLLELVEAASKHNGQSAGKAKHLDDVLYASNSISKTFYSKKVEVLVKRVYDNHFVSYAVPIYINYEDLDDDYSKNEPQVYIWYKIKETGKPYKIKLPRK